MIASNLISMITSIKPVESEAASNTGRGAVPNVPTPIGWRIISVLWRIVQAIHQMMNARSAPLTIPSFKDNASRRILIV